MVCAVGKIQVQPHCCETEPPTEVECPCGATFPNYWEATIDDYVASLVFPLTQCQEGNATFSTNPAFNLDGGETLCQWTESPARTISNITGGATVSLTVQVRKSDGTLVVCGSTITAGHHVLIVNDGMTTWWEDLGTDPPNCTLVDHEMPNQCGGCGATPATCRVTSFA